MKVIRDRLVLPAAALLLVGISSTGFAQSASVGTQVAERVPAAISYPAPEWGTTAQIIHKVSITDFRTNDSTFSLAVYAPADLRFFQNAPSSTGDWWAQAKLPSGAIIDSVELDACDISSSGSILFGMAWTAAGGTTGGNLTPAGDTGGAAIPECAFFSVTPLFPPLVVDNQNFNYWVFVSWSGDFTPALRVAGVRIRFRLQVSPAPSVATFADVPVGSLYFRFVEALYASGITAGCGGGNFCPNASLTRGQMAVFLATALGLHFPN